MTRRTFLELPQNLTVAGWQRIGEQINVISDSSAWWLGDWLIFGQERFPNFYRSAVEQTSLDYQTLRNYSWIARKFPPARRRAGLSFQHHVEVAALPEREQNAWLQRAEALGWSRNELRKRLRQDHRTIESPDAARPVKLVVPADRRKLWEQAARSAKTDLSAWMLTVLDEAARRSGA